MGIMVHSLSWVMQDTYIYIYIISSSLGLLSFGLKGFRFKASGCEFSASRGSSFRRSELQGSTIYP